MKKLVAIIFVLFLLGFLLLEIVTVVDLLNDRQPPTVWIGDEY